MCEWVGMSTQEFDLSEHHTWHNISIEGLIQSQWMAHSRTSNLKSKKNARKKIKIKDFFYF